MVARGSVLDAICSHHILCIGDATIPYARLSALCLEAQCPRRLRDNFRIYVHLDGLRQDPQRAAEWFRRSSRTEVTTGLFGIPPDEYVPGKWHQAMVNTVSTEFSQEPVVAFVDADCFVTDSSWFLTAQRLCCNFRAATSGWTTFGKHRTGSPIMPSDNPFKWRQFEPALILQCVRWYLRYALSYRDLEDMMRERGLCVDHTTIYRWVQRYAPEIDKRCRPFLRRTNDSYRIDETYVRVAGAWTYLYRGVDSNGDTLDFLLRATRDRKAAIAFFRKTLGAAHPTPPRVVTVDKNPAYPVAFEAVRHEGLVRPRSNLRQCKYLNNIIEQDHRFIKRRTRPMLGFKRFTTAWRTLRGIEIMHALRKGQARWMAKGDVVGQTQLIHKVFGLAA